MQANSEEDKVDKDRMLRIYADGKVMGEFKWSRRKAHRSLFNLAGVEIRDIETGQLVSEAKICEEDEADSLNEEVAA